VIWYRVFQQDTTILCIVSLIMAWLAIMVNKKIIVPLMPILILYLCIVQVCDIVDDVFNELYGFS